MSRRVILTVTSTTSIYCVYVGYIVPNMKVVVLLLTLLALHGYSEGWKFPEEPKHRNDVHNSANKFALDLYKAALKKERGNFISSPFSVYMVLAMTLFGARGETSAELQKVLHLSMNTPSRFTEVAKDLREFNRKFQHLKPVSLEVGNKIFTKSDVSLNRNFQAAIADIFSSAAEKVDFKNSKQAAEQINSWSNKLTHGKIKEIVNPRELSPSTALMLVNSVYFYGKWKLPFAAEATYPRDFYINEQYRKEVPMMLQEGEYQISKLPNLDATAVVLPYQDGGVREDATYMYLIKPNRIDGLPKIEKNIEFLDLAALRNAEARSVELTVPKFQMESQFNMNDYLQELGLNNAFSSSADFGAMVDSSSNLAISRVVQKAFIGIDEKGTEAAASTSVGIQDKMGPARYSIDRPFLMILATEDVILFTGKIIDPSL